MNEFEKIYREAILKRNNIHKELGYDQITPAFNKDGDFDKNNWNDPLLSIFRNELYFEAFDKKKKHDKITGTVFREQDQTTLILQNEYIIYALSWYKNRGRTEELFQLSEPQRTVNLDEIYEFFVDCEIDIIKFLLDLE